MIWLVAVGFTIHAWKLYVQVYSRNFLSTKRQSPELYLLKVKLRALVLFLAFVRLVQGQDVGFAFLTSGSDTFQGLFRSVETVVHVREDKTDLGVNTQVKLFGGFVALRKFNRLRGGVHVLILCSVLLCLDALTLFDENQKSNSFGKVFVDE
jgi:hypothetical protein